MKRALVFAGLGFFAVLAEIAAPLQARAQILQAESKSIHSQILGEDRTVFVSLPASYSRGADRYPVVYLPDADFNFAHTQTSAQLLARNRIIPPLIVIGVTNPDRTRDLYATQADFKHNGRTIRFPNSGKADQFLAFVERELIPWVDRTYRTSDLRILAGYSAGGNFALHAMRTKPGLFQAILAGSPWLAWDDHRERKELVPFLGISTPRVRAVFLTYANEGAVMQSDVEALVSVLRQRTDSSVRWASRSYPDETHDTGVLKAFYDGLRMLFDGYDYPRDPSTNLLNGSLEKMDAHYSRFGARLGVSFAPPEVLVNELGYRDLAAGRHELAIASFRFNVDRHPASANAWDSLGEGLERAGKADEARACYRKAVALAEAQRDPRLDTYRRRLK
jgi:predicted alpha/beta superfamily hydrolase